MVSVELGSPTTATKTNTPPSSNTATSGICSVIQVDDDNDTVDGAIICDDRSVESHWINGP